MSSFKSSTFIFLLIISVCLAHDDDNQEVARKRYKHKLHHLYHNPYFYYLAFLVVKLKFAFLIGSMIIFALFASKTYALLRYGILTQKNKEPEKIYIQSASEHHPTYFSSEDDHGHEFSHDFTSGGSFYGRGFDIQNDIVRNYDLIQDFINKFDLNEFAFNELDIKDAACRRRFVCEADIRAQNDTIFNIEMYLIRDNNFIKYKSQDMMTNTLTDCAKLCSFT